MAITVLILAAGTKSSDVDSSGYPLCLTEVNGTSLLENIIRNTQNIESATYSFAFLRKEAKQFHLDKVADLLAPNPTVIQVPESTQGSACTALLCASQLNPDNELLMISANELVDIDLSLMVDDFRDRNLDAGTPIFQSIHPRYSYVRLNRDRLVTEAAQQEPISQNATAGIFWFAKTNAFVEAAMSTIRKDSSVDEKYYIAPTFNELILQQARIGVFDLTQEKYMPLKSEWQIQQFGRGLKS